MKQLKQLVSYLLVCCLLLTILPITVLATDEGSDETESIVSTTKTVSEDMGDANNSESETENNENAEEASESTEETITEETTESAPTGEISPITTEKSTDISTGITDEVVSHNNAANAGVIVPPAVAAFWDKPSITFDESNEEIEVGATTAISAVYVSKDAPDEIEWNCSVPDAVYFTATSVLNPAPIVEGEENTWWISVTVTGVLEGSYEVTLSVNGHTSDPVNLTITEAVTSRYTVLVLDASGSMAGTPATEQREAAIKFCESVLTSTGRNYIAIVKLASTSSVGCNFTNDLATLTSYINAFPANSGTNTNHALEIAGNLLDGVTDSGKNVMKNIVVCSDGLPQSGSTTSDGPYTSADSSGYYRYANYCYNTATALKGKEYPIYSLGFFHSLSGSELEFGKRFMSDIATENCYYEVVNAEDLEFTFGEIAEDITVEPVSIDVSNVESISETNERITYRINANITNNSKSTALTNLFVNIDEGDNATITEGEWKQTADTLAAAASMAFHWTIQIDRSAYGDGGVHEFIVYAGSDQTVTASVKGSIAIDPINSQSNKLDFSKDVWNFHNFSEEKVNPADDKSPRVPHKMTDEDKNVLRVGLSASNRAILEKVLGQGSNGHCFGMALTTILSKMNIFDISDYTNVSVLRKADLNDRVWSIIGYYHLVQYFDKYSNNENTFKDSHSARDKLAILAEKANAVKSGGCPVLVTFGCEGWGGHAVVAYALEPGSWTWDGTTYDRQILIYDCNAANGNPNWFDWNPIRGDEYCLYFNDGTDEWIIPKYKTYSKEIENEETGIKETQTFPCMVSTNSENASIWNVCDDLDILNTTNYDANFYNYAAELRYQNETAIRLNNGNKQYVIMGKSGSVSGNSDISILYDHNAMSNQSSIGTLRVILPSNDDYIISTLSEQKEPLNFYVKYDNKLLSVNTVASEGARFGATGGLSLAGNEGLFELTIADDTIPSGEFNTYTVKGDTDGNIAVTVTDDGITVTGDNLEGITIEASEGSTSDTITISEKIDEIELGREGTELVVIQSEKHKHTSSEPVKENVHNASCESSGSYESVVYCAVCGEEVSRKTVSIPATGHDYKNGKCENCGDVKTSTSTSTSTHTHSAGSKWYANDTQHWHVCSCGIELQISKHSYSSDTDATCNVCGFKRTVEEIAEETTVPTIAETKPMEETVEITEPEVTETVVTTEKDEEEILFADEVEDNSDSSGFGGILITVLVIVMILSLVALAGLLIFKLRRKF